MLARAKAYVDDNTGTCGNLGVSRPKGVLIYVGGIARSSPQVARTFPTFWAHIFTKQQGALAGHPRPAGAPNFLNLSFNAAPVGAFMPFESLSIENRILSRLQELRTSATFLAALDGQISQTGLAQAIRGIKRLDNRDGERLGSLTLRLLALRDAFYPLCLNFDDLDGVRALLKIQASDSEIQATIQKWFT
jgi:hypothetical protein